MNGFLLSISHIMSCLGMLLIESCNSSQNVHFSAPFASWVVRRFDGGCLCVLWLEPCCDHVSFPASINQRHCYLLALHQVKSSMNTVLSSWGSPLMTASPFYWWRWWGNAPLKKEARETSVMPLQKEWRRWMYLFWANEEGNGSTYSWISEKCPLENAQDLFFLFQTEGFHLFI